MWNAFRGALAVLTRKTELAVWALIFPIILSTLFMFMFANLAESPAFEAVPTAVVADDAYRADEGFSTLVDELSQPGDAQLLDVREFATAEEARGRSRRATWLACCPWTARACRTWRCRPSPTAWA